MSSTKLLAYYDPNSEIDILAKANPVDLGSVLIQKVLKGKQIVNYASKSLSDQEKETFTHVWSLK